MRFPLPAGVLLVFALTNVACDKIKSPQPALQAPPAASGAAVEKTGEHKTFAQGAQIELDEMGAAIAELRTKVGASNVTTKAKLSEELEKLETDFRETQSRLTDMKAATADTWDQLKETFGKSLNKPRNSMANLRKSSS